MSRKAVMTAKPDRFYICVACVSHQVRYHLDQSCGQYCISIVVTLFLSPLGNGRGKRLIGIYTTGYLVFLSIKAPSC